MRVATRRWWNRNGSLETPARNAHSEPLELLAELGPLGLLAFVAFFAIAGAEGVRQARRDDGAAPGAAIGLLATALIGMLIDWTWDLPAVMLPVLVVRCGDLHAGAGSPAGAHRPAGVGHRCWAGCDAIPAPALALVAIVVRGPRPSGLRACSPCRPIGSRPAMRPSPTGS